jgi:translocation and assembly module TamA
MRALWALALAAGGCTTVYQGGATADAPTINEVAISGNREVGDDDIINGLSNRPPERENLFLKVYRQLDRLALEQDISRIEAYYRQRGFYSAKVIGTDIQPAGDNEVRVTFRVDEGYPVRVSGISIMGLGGGLQRSVALGRETSKFKRGSVFRHDLYAEFKTWISTWLAHRGFPHGLVAGEVKVDRDAHTADIVLKVDRGPFARFGKTEVKGLNRLPEGVVRKRLDWEEGDSLRPENLQRTQSRLYQLGLFSAVRMEIERENRPRDTDVTITLTEARRHELRLGGGVAVSGGFDPQALRIEARQRTSYLMRGVISPIATLRLEARPGWEWRQKEGTNSPVGEATATLERPDVIFPRTVGTIEVGYQQTQLQAYILRGPLVRLGLSRPLLDDRLQVALGWRFRRLDFDELSVALDGKLRELNLRPGEDDMDPGEYVEVVDNPDTPEDERADSNSEIALREDIGLREPYRLGVLEQTISYDWRHPNPLNSRWGAYAALTVSEGASALGGNVPFMKGAIDTRAYVPVIKGLSEMIDIGLRDPQRRFVVAGRVLYERVLGSDPLPITERFFDGGASGHRGFTYQNLSPTVEEDIRIDPPEAPMGVEEVFPVDPPSIGGEEHFLGSAEVRWDITDIKTYPFGIVLFTDAGDVLREVGDLKLTDLHWAAGVGLRYEPVVSIRLDFGYRLNRREPDDPVPDEPFAFHFSLGQAF